MADESQHELIDELADEFLTKRLRGQKPDMEEYCKAYPWLADKIRQLFPMLQFLESNKDQRRSFSVPDQVGSYKIERELGRGGMAIVFQGAHIESGAKAAVKILLPDRETADDSLISRFEREAEAVRRIDHPYVVPLTEYGNTGELRYLVMRLIDGLSMDRILRLLASAYRSNPQEWSGSVMQHVSSAAREFTTADYYHWVIRVGRRVAEALNHAHELGILHRDMKPSNLLVDRSSEPWLADFGLAKTDDARLTRTGQIIGTLRYLAPERLRGQCDRRSDIYGLGITLYELLALRPAFEDHDRLKLIANVEQSSPPSPRKFIPEVPADLEKVVLQAMAKDPEQRFRSADKLAQALAACE